MELLAQFWPYLDRAGAVAAIILLWMLLKSESERATLTKDKDALHAARTTEVQAMTQVIERNTAAMSQQAQVLQTVLNVIGSNPDRG